MNEKYSLGESKGYRDLPRLLEVPQEARRGRRGEDGQVRKKVKWRGINSEYSKGHQNQPKHYSAMQSCGCTPGWQREVTGYDERDGEEDGRRSCDVVGEIAINPVCKEGEKRGRVGYE